MNVDESYRARFNKRNQYHRFFAKIKFQNIIYALIIQKKKIYRNKKRNILIYKQHTNI